MNHKSSTPPRVPEAPASTGAVCLVSFHPVVLSEFQRLLSDEGFDLQVCCLESNRIEELTSLSLPPSSVYVVDARAERQAIEALVTGILSRTPAARLVVLAERFDEATAFTLLRLGTKGLLTYAEASQALPRALREVAAGGFWVPRSLLSRFVDSALSVAKPRPSPPGNAELTRREQEVLSTLLENLSNKEIARKLHISERTAKFHVSNLLVKFGVKRRADLILLCFVQPLGR